MESSDEEIGSWLEREVAGCQFQDVRHRKRFRTLLVQLAEQIGGSIPFTCQDWAATKAACRFLSNPRVDEGKILAGHFLCTRQRFAVTAADSPVLMLHDRTEFSYQRENPEAIGVLKKMKTMYASKGQPGYHTTCGILMHSSLVVTTGGLPLGLPAIKFWTRDKFHRANALKRKINPTRVPTEQLPTIAQDALEAGFDGPHVLRMAIIDPRYGWEIDQALPLMLAELGCSSIPKKDAALRRSVSVSSSPLACRS